ncbi:hypothetical protein AALP_AAs61717U000100 [Arabis alpina]|uniref:Uncharacterized protein n=1 Tax=Arabis alpina TaxID=50452 RepID=A0A087G3P4_ARAAL|nr:hypothetical protein AALP_AAs61717U000100 [Arabis alpina]
MPQTVKNPVRKPPAREVTGGRGTVVDRGRGTVGEDVGGGNGSQRKSFLSAGGGNNGPNKAQSETSVGQGLRQGTGLIRAGVYEVVGTSGSRAREGRSSEQTLSGAMSRTSYPPQNPLQRHPLPLVNQPPPLQASDEEMNNSDEEVDFNIGLELEDEEEDEFAAPNPDDAPNPVDAPNAGDQDFDQLLDDLLRLPGQE